VTPGELYWVNLPHSNGHEQAGRRPAVVIQDDVYAGTLGTALVVPVTGQPANARFPGTVAVAPSAQNGLLRSSVVLVFQVRALDRRRFLNRIGVVEPAVLADILAELDRLTGRPPVTAALPALPPADPPEVARSSREIQFD
jgi:mRNA interferase MazF